MNNLPKISIVTPSYNQGDYLEETIQSVLAQGYGRLEYVIMDGGSTDCSVDILKRYDRSLTYWDSKPDKGQYAAINDGFNRTTGEIMGWINSDDKYTPWSFSIISEIFSNFPNIDWITAKHRLVWDQHGRAVRCLPTGGYNKYHFYKGQNLGSDNHFNKGWIQQESTFWRRSLWEKVGSQIPPSFPMAGDFALWTAFFDHSDLCVIDAPLGGFRRHGNQRSVKWKDQYISEAFAALNESNKFRRMGKLQNLYRRLVHTCIGDRALYVESRPQWLSTGAMKLLGFQPATNLAYTENRWMSRNGYII